MGGGGEREDVDEAFYQGGLLLCFAFKAVFSNFGLVHLRRLAPIFQGLN